MCVIVCVLCIVMYILGIRYILCMILYVFLFKCVFGMCDSCQVHGNMTKLFQQ